jgi:hypothetical protein
MCRKVTEKALKWVRLRDRNLLSSTKVIALDAFQSMIENTTGRVLVLDFADPTKLLGVITKADLMHASSSAIHRQMSQQRLLMSTNFYTTSFYVLRVLIWLI